VRVVSGLGPVGAREKLSSGEKRKESQRGSSGGLRKKTLLNRGEARWSRGSRVRRTRRVTGLPRLLRNKRRESGGNLIEETPASVHKGRIRPDPAFKRERNARTLPVNNREEKEGYVTGIFNVQVLQKEIRSHEKGTTFLQRTTNISLYRSKSPGHRRLSGARLNRKGRDKKGYILGGLVGEAKTGGQQNPNHNIRSDHNFWVNKRRV